MAPRGAVVIMAVISSLLLVGSAQASSPVERQIQSLFWAITWFAIGVAVSVFFIMFWFMIRYRQSVSPASETHVEGHRKVEAVWTAIPIVILVIITAMSWPVLMFTDTPPTPDTTIQVVGFQWAWRFEYKDGTNSSNEVWVQENIVVRFEVTSLDVIHSFRIQQLGIIIDAIPGRVNTFWLKAEQPGDYLTQCAEFCVIGHYGMRAVIHVFAAGSQPKPYGPPPRPLPSIDVQLRESGGNLAKPWSIDPPAINATSGEVVRLRIWNNNSHAYTFEIDPPVDVRVNVAAFRYAWLNFTPGLPAEAVVPYGPTDANARDMGMVGALNVTVAIVIELHDGPFAVRPNPLTLEKGRPVKFLIRNVGSLLHNFTMGGKYSYVKHDPLIPSGGSVVIGPFPFDEDASGSYWCAVPGHRALGMVAPYLVGAGGAVEVQRDIPLFEMVLLTFGVGGFATLVYVVRHARRRDG